VLNNLALAYAMEGAADKAEPLLKPAAAAGAHASQVSQNLALVLGLQRKYDAAKLTAARDLTDAMAADNLDSVPRMAKLERKACSAAVAERAQGQLKGTEPAAADADAASAWAPQVATNGAQR